jgi:hypothetical protein
MQSKLEHQFNACGCEGREKKSSIWSRTLASFHFLLLRVLFFKISKIIVDRNI